MLQSGHEAVRLEGEEMTALARDFSAYDSMGLVRLQPGRWLYPARYTHFADALYNFKWRQQDVLLMTYPKCGTTWTQEILWAMRNDPDVLHPAPAAMDVVPFLDADMFFPAGLSRDDPMVTSSSSRFLELCPDAQPDDGMLLQLTAALQGPRTVKTHLPLSLLNPSLLSTVKVVYVARNPKDVCLSYLHHSRLFTDVGYKGSLQQFIDYLVNDDCVYGPYWLHVKEAWQQRHHPNLHWIFFEDLKKDPMKELRRLNVYLDTKLTEDQLSKINDHTHFSKMKERNLKGMDGWLDKDVLQQDGGFFRKGVSGDWKETMTPTMIAQMDAWIADKFDFGITFD